MGCTGVASTNTTSGSRTSAGNEQRDSLVRLHFMFIHTQLCERLRFGEMSQQTFGEDRNTKLIGV